MEANNHISKVDIKQLTQKVWSSRLKFIKLWCLVIVISSLIIFPMPRYYVSSTSVSPESADALGGGGLASLASSFGINMGNSSADAIFPQLYPDLFASTQFMVEIMDVKVTTIDKEVTTDYFTYLRDYDKQHFAAIPFTWLTTQLAKLRSSKSYEPIAVEGQRFNPFMLSRSEDKIFSAAKNKIECNYSRTSNVVTITVEDQDPLVCATMADSISGILQRYITHYRTSKARQELDYYTKLVSDAKAGYDSASFVYSNFVNTHRNINLEQYKMELESIRNEVDMKSQMYSTLVARMQAADAKVLDQTPAFTVLVNSTVPVKPNGPKRLIFVLSMLILSTIVYTAWLFRKDLLSWI